jgi:2'-hydroxyisoflavone reductase
MKILVLGGTQFLGKTIVETAVAAGHDVSIFHRGRTNPGLFPELEHLIGDRDGGLDVLHGRTWDAVIDVSGYIPRLVRDSATLLAPNIGHYTFISTISVYEAAAQGPLAEDAPLGTLADETVEEVNGQTYGPLKVLCEKAAEEATNGRSLSVRAGLLVGPEDYTDRFTYWPVRIAKGGDILAPESPDVPTQFIDVRDIAAWVVQATEKGLTGPYNVTGPANPLTLGALFATCQQVTGSQANFVWADEAFLLEQGVAPFSEMPLWIPTARRGMMQVDCRKAMADGLVYRPLEETIRDTLAWANGRSANHEWRGGLKPEREAALLAMIQ